MSCSNLVLAVDVGTTPIKSAIMDLSTFEAVKKDSTRAVVEYPKNTG